MSTEEWRKVAGMPFWQEVWRQELEGHIDIAQLLDRHGDELPAPCVNKRDLPVPVDNSSQTLWGSAKRTKIESVIVCNPPRVVKTKPTGKPKDISELINFEAYFYTHLFESGFTYRRHFIAHKTGQSFALVVQCNF
jgi:hypothetical protein